MIGQSSPDAEVGGDQAATSRSGPATSAKRPRQARRRRYEKLPASKPSPLPLALSTRAIALLVRRLPRAMRKRYEGDVVEFMIFGGRLTAGTLLRVAARCSRSELLAERNVGRTTVDEIERWLASHNRSFRPDAESLESALQRAVDHIEAMIEAQDQEVFLTAFLALPELKRTLRIAGGRGG